MVAPIGVDDPQLGDGGVPVLLVPEVVPAELQVREGHGEAHGVEILLHLPVVPLGKACDPGHVGGDFRLKLQARRLFHGGLPALHGVNQVVLHRLELPVGHLAL